MGVYSSLLLLHMGLVCPLHSQFCLHKEVPVKMKKELCGCRVRVSSLVRRDLDRGRKDGLVGKGQGWRSKRPRFFPTLPQMT